MLISKRKVVTLARGKRVDRKVVCLLDELEDELEGEYDFSELKDELVGNQVQGVCNRGRKFWGVNNSPFVLCKPRPGVVCGHG